MPRVNDKPVNAKGWGALNPRDRALHAACCGFVGIFQKIRLDRALVLPAVVSLLLTATTGNTAESAELWRTSAASLGVDNFYWTRQLLGKLIGFPVKVGWASAKLGGRVAKESALAAVHVPLVVGQGVLATAEMIAYELQDHAQRARVPKLDGGYFLQEGYQTKPLERGQH